jgi:hypothetical protein
MGSQESSERAGEPGEPAPPATYMPRLVPMLICFVW